MVPSRSAERCSSAHISRAGSAQLGADQWLDHGWHDAAPRGVAAPVAVRVAAQPARPHRQCGHTAELSVPNAVPAPATPCAPQPGGSRQSPHHLRRPRRGHDVEGHRTRAWPPQHSRQDRHQLAGNLGRQPTHDRNQPQRPADRPGAHHSGPCLGRGRRRRDAQRPFAGACPHCARPAFAQNAPACRTTRPRRIHRASRPVRHRSPT